MANTAGVCVACTTPTSNTCCRCHAVHYCSPKCVAQHYELHRYLCTPVPARGIRASLAAQLLTQAYERYDLVEFSMYQAEHEIEERQLKFTMREWIENCSKFVARDSCAAEALARSRSPDVVDRADAYICYAHNDAMFDALVPFLLTLPDDPTVWVDVLCSRRDVAPFDAPASGLFMDALMRTIFFIPEMYVVLSTYQAPAALTRMWALWEIRAALSVRKSPRFVLAPTALHTFRMRMEGTADVPAEYFERLIGAVKVKRARCENAEDAARLRAAFSDEDSNAVDDFIRESLIYVYTEAFEASINARRDGDPLSKEAAILHANAGHFYSTVTKWGDAVRCYRHGITFHELYAETEEFAGLSPSTRRLVVTAHLVCLYDEARCLIHEGKYERAIASARQGLSVSLQYCPDVREPHLEHGCELVLVDALHADGRSSEAYALMDSMQLPEPVPKTEDGRSRYFMEIYDDLAKRAVRGENRVRARTFLMVCRRYADRLLSSLQGSSEKMGTPLRTLEEWRSAKRMDLSFRWNLAHLDIVEGDVELAKSARRAMEKVLGKATKLFGINDPNVATMIKEMEKLKRPMVIARTRIRAEAVPAPASASAPAPAPAPAPDSITPENASAALQTMKTELEAEFGLLEEMAQKLDLGKRD